MKTDCLTYSFIALREKLHQSALRFLHDDEDAKDALQDTFFRLWKTGPPETESEARNKLFTVLKNICIDKLRKRSMFSIGNSETDTMTVMPDDIEDIGQLEQLLSSGLTDIQRQIYELVVHDGVEYDEIAVRMGMTIEAVRMNMSRARKRIRENYQKLNK